MKKRFLFSNLILIVCLLLTACTAAPPGPESTEPADAVPETPAITPGPETLEGVVWRLLSYSDPKGNRADILPETRITAQFNTNQIEGSAGCNRYFAEYQVDEYRLRFINIGATEMFCAQPQGIMEQETAYLQALRGVTTFQLADDRLQLRDDAGHTLLTFAQDDIPAIVLTVTPEAVNQGLVTPTTNPLSQEALRNAVFLSDWTANGLAPLQEGEFRQQAAPGSASEIVVTLTEWHAQGTLPDGRPFVAVILITDSGGSGVFYDLAVVVEENGAPKNIANIQLGDRIQVSSLTVDGEEISIDMLTAGPEDAFCCPTQREMRRYTLLEGVLQLTSSEVITESELVSTVWQWLEFQGMDDSLIINDQPGQYTLEFMEDGTLRIKADCNQAEGRYKAQDSSLQIEVGISTLAQCAPGSMSEDFLENLGYIGSYIIEDGNLYLALIMDGGILKFSPHTP